MTIRKNAIIEVMKILWLTLEEKWYIIYEENWEWFYWKKQWWEILKNRSANEFIYKPHFIKTVLNYCEEHNLFFSLNKMIEKDDPELYLHNLLIWN